MLYMKINNTEKQVKKKKKKIGMVRYATPSMFFLF